MKKVFTSIVPYNRNWFNNLRTIAGSLSEIIFHFPTPVFLSALIELFAEKDSAEKGESSLQKKKYSAEIRKYSADLPGSSAQKGKHSAEVSGNSPGKRKYSPEVLGSSARKRKYSPELPGSSPKKRKYSPLFPGNLMLKRYLRLIDLYKTLEINILGTDNSPPTLNKPSVSRAKFNPLPGVC